MSPEHIAGNMWRLLKDEYIIGRYGNEEATLAGPQIVRIYEYPELEKFSVQGKITIEVDGINFEVTVKKKGE